MLKMQNHALAIRQELGYPLFKPIDEIAAFTAGGPVDIAKAMEIAAVAQTMRKDLVHVAWSAAAESKPVDYAVAFREPNFVDWIDRCFFWAADETSPIVIVSARRDEHFARGARGLLERRAGKPAKNMAKGKKLAMRRILSAAAAMGDQMAGDNVWLERGSTWSEPLAPSGECIVRFN